MLILMFSHYLSRHSGINQEVADLKAQIDEVTNRLADEVIANHVE